jgi:hypothetical protein
LFAPEASSLDSLDSITSTETSGPLIDLQAPRPTSIDRPTATVSWKTGVACWNSMNVRHYRGATTPRAAAPSARTSAAPLERERRIDRRPKPRSCPRTLLASPASRRQPRLSINWTPTCSTTKANLSSVSRRRATRPIARKSAAASKRERLLAVPRPAPKAVGNATDAEIEWQR